MDLNDYINFRWFYTSEGNLIIGGKNEKQNELVIKKFLKPNYYVLHTSQPGSPFMIIQSEKPSKNDINEAAIFCGCFSKQWKLRNNDKITIEVFMGSQIYKKKGMKTGSFGVIGNIKKMNVKPRLILTIQNGILRAVPKIKEKEAILCEIRPGKLSKEEAFEKISEKIKDKSLSFKKEEIMTAIPSGMIDVE